MITIRQNDTQIEFLTQLRDIMFYTTAGKAQVTITCNSVLVYDETLSGTVITIGDMPGLLAPFVDEGGYGATFTVHIEEADGTAAEFAMRVVQCRVEAGSFADFANSHFLTLHEEGVRTYPWAKESVSLWQYAAEGTVEKPSCSVRAYYTDGTYADHAVTLTGGERVAPTFPAVGDAADSAVYYFGSFLMSDYMVEGKQLYRLVLRCGERTREFLIDSQHEMPSPILRFANTFGYLEYLYCHGKRESAPEYERTHITVLGQMRTARVRERRYWNADTGILSPEEAEWALELMSSPTVYECRVKDGEVVIWKEVVITEQDCLYTNEDDNLPRYTFKYRLAQPVHHVPDVRRHPEIFTDTYTPTYE